MERHESDSRVTKAPRRGRWLRLGVVGLGLAGLAAGGTLTLGPRRAAASTSSTPPPRMIVNPYNGTVAGTLPPSTSYSVVVTRSGVQKAAASGTTNSSGYYSASVGWNDGNGPGIHNGDTVTVSTPSARYQQPVQLAGYLDEVTGRFTGLGRPSAAVSVKLYTNGDLANLVWTGSTSASKTGSFTFNFASYVKPIGSGAAPWRGYEALVTSSDTAGQEVFRPIQTPNTTLDATTDLVGGGYFWPGDNVTYSLSRSGGTVATVTVAADQDGIPSTTLSSPVQAGDVLSTAYHDPSGHARTQVLDPMDLTAVIDPVSSVVTGTTGSGSPVEAQYFAPTGVVGVIGRADSTGAYTLDFAAKGVTFVGNTMVLVDRIADPTFTGVGAQQIEGRSPAVSVQDATGKVSGYGMIGVNPVRVDQVRSGAVVASASGVSSASGAFNGIQLPATVLPGDTVTVTTGSQTLPPFSVGAALSAVANQTQPGPLGWVYSGTGQPGRTIQLVVSTSSGNCLASATVDSSGSWSAPLPCSLTGTEWAELVETGTSASDGPAAGSNILRYVNLATPSQAP